MAMASRAKQGRGKRRGALAAEIRWKSPHSFFSMWKISGVPAFNCFWPSNSRRLSLNATDAIPAESAGPHLVGQTFESKPADKKYLKLNGRSVSC